MSRRARSGAAWWRHRPSSRLHDLTCSTWRSRRTLPRASCLSSRPVLAHPACPGHRHVTDSDLGCRWAGVVGPGFPCVHLRPRGPALDLVGDMQLERLIAALAPTDVVGSAAVEIRELAYDAREVPRDSLFFCIPGASADGHDFAAAAVEAGAAAPFVAHP